MTLCSVADCDGARWCKGYCMKHYYRVKRHGHSDLSHEARFQPCAVSDCRRLQTAKGLCNTHYNKLSRFGTLDPIHLFDGKAQERNRARTAAWKKANWPAYKAYLATCKARVKQATPAWADLAAIRAFYRNCPPGFHVDHIVPLNGKTISGLHVLPNLQYLPATENLRKGNRFGGK